MKNFLLVLALVAVVCVSATSCFKGCNCTDYDSDGNVTSTYSQPIVRGAGMKCADYNVSDSYGKTICGK